MRLLVKRQGAATGRFKMPHGQRKRRTDETKTPEEKLKNAERNERRPGISRRGFFPSGLTILMPIPIGSDLTNKNGRAPFTRKRSGVERARVLPEPVHVSPWADGYANITGGGS
jgi:hypothetical protein